MEFDDNIVRPLGRGNCISYAGLPADSAQRQYYRLHMEDDSTLIAMVLADEEFKKSENTNLSIPVIEPQFINVQKSLASRIRVPHIYHYDKENGIIFEEDLGHVMFYDFAQKLDRKDRRILYADAIDIILEMQRIRHMNDIVAFHRSFYYDLYMWEMKHFIDFALSPFPETDLNTQQKLKLIREFEFIANMLHQMPMVLTHRDFHSRNIMLLGNTDFDLQWDDWDLELAVIDFQDALLGPMTYDIASLLRDCYIDLDEDLEGQLLWDFMHELDRRGELSADEFLDFRAMFEMTALERNLKAIGRFFYFYLVNHKTTHLKYIEPTIKKALRAVRSLGSVPVIQEVLESSAEAMIKNARTN